MRAIVVKMVGLDHGRFDQLGVTRAEKVKEKRALEKIKKILVKVDKQIPACDGAD